MTKEQFKTYFNANFAGVQNLIDIVLTPMLGQFTSKTLTDRIADMGDGNANINHIFEYGSYQVVGEVSVWEVVLSDNCRINQARKNIQNVVRQLLGTYSGAFVIFHYADGSTNPDAATWRLSWIKKEATQAGATSAKRYTYLCGPAYSCRTIAERFDVLQNTPSKTLDSITAAFDVEALSDEFFYNFRAIYSKIKCEGEKWKSKKYTTPYAKLSDIKNDKDLGFCDFIERYKNDTRYFGEEFTRWESKLLRDYIKKMMGRLVFLQFLQKKGWMCGNPNYLKSLFEKFVQGKRENVTDTAPGSFLDEVLEPLFFGVLNTKAKDREELFKNEKWNLDLLNEWKDIPYLNGGLFEQEVYDKPKSAFPNVLFNELFTLFSEYNFTIDENDPDDKEVGIDPEMLSKIFESQLEDNKDKGAFYTPKEIVEYMCKESLIAYLQTDITDEGKKENIRSFVCDSEAALQDGLKPSVAEKLKNVKICDPAIGSGAFPMGMLNMLVSTREKIESVQNRLELKKEIICNNLYGVDIEKGAVDIARLRFWLSLVIDEDEPAALPNLDYKIVQGDSLIHRFALDASFDSVFKEYNKDNKTKYTVQDYQTWVKEYQNTSDHTKKDEFRKKIEEVKSAFKTALTKKDSDKVIKIQRAIYECESPKLFELTPAEKKSEKEKVSKLKKQLESLINEQESIKNNVVYKNAFEWRFEFPQILDENGNFDGFDIVIGNPPYVSTKDGGDAEIKKNKEVYKQIYGFADDLYSHFVFMGFDLLKDKGIQSMITSDTYFTTYTKTNLRELLLKNSFVKLVHWGHDVFDTAMVSTATFVSRKEKTMENHEFDVYDVKGKKKIENGKQYTIAQSKYNESINRAFYIPNQLCSDIDAKYSAIHSVLLKNWWDKIDTSAKIAKNESLLNSYRSGLHSGDVTLLGLVTDGGQGLATANNGKFVGVRYDSKLAKRIEITRVQKLKEFNQKYGKTFEMPNDELEIWKLFDQLKEEKGRDVFGQGYLFRIVPQELLADVTTLSENEKQNGIDGKKSFVPYEKGDKDGNRWFLDTPYLIDWSVENVNFLISNSGKKGEGMPVVRNKRFYFREGFCYSDIKTFFLRCRQKEVTIHDVKSMSLFPLLDYVPYYYLVLIVNSHLIATFVYNFLNNTPDFQINDSRMLPVIVPNQEQLKKSRSLFDSAVQIQKKFFAKTIDEETRNKELQKVQDEVDEFVYSVYDIKTTEYLKHVNKPY